MLRSASVNSASYFSDNNTTAPSTAVNTAREAELKPSTAFDAAKAIAFRTLKALSKTSVSALQLDAVPKELLFGETVDLHRWTMILTDNNLKELSEQQNSGKLYYLDASAARVTDMFNSFYRPMKLKSGLLNLNIANAKDITNFGVTVIVRNNPHLLSLNVSGCSNVTDIALREIGMNCPRIESLNISSCQEIDGSGLGAIADSCHALLRVDFSKCRKIEMWSMKKIFYECKLLEDVNVSYLSKVGDEEIRVLAQNCPNLVTLRAAESPYVSDTSIQIIAEQCPDLDLLDVSRSEMQYRISDVSMLALGSKARSLRTLLAGGCDTISDVGLNWLTEGCKVLEELDFSSCTKLTDAGMRSIGTHCHALVSINISQARMVTDVGIASLTTGCPALRHVKLHGVFMLSDPRLSAPKKGAKLEAWQAVIGVAALAQHCGYVESLDLSGCFRLNIALHQYVSSFSHLTALNLAGCNQCTPEALAAVARGCTLIQELNLSDCGKAANNKAVQAFGAHCRGLKTLSLCRCTHVSGGGMKAVSSLRLLEKLDLTGCKTLTDSMLIYLTEVDKVPLLRTLSMVDIPSVSDSLVSWLSIKSQNILLLALKGTAVSIRALKSVRDRFPNSEMLQNDNFYGFWPKQRVDDRMLLNKYYGFIDGVTRIQGRIRKHRAVMRVRKIQEEWRRIAAQMLLQKVVRGFLARARTHLVRAALRKRHLSAIIITSVFRIPVAKKKCDRRRAYLRNIYKNEKAVQIQLCWRKHRDRGILHQKRLAKLRLAASKQFGALKMQSIARIYFARGRIRKIKALKRTREEVAHRKATVIQRNYRGTVARRITENFRQIFVNLARNRLEAAIRIQRKVRCLRTQHIIDAAIYVKHHRLECVVRMQSVMRGALARIHVAEMRTEAAEEVRLRAAIRIQTRMRMLRAYIELQRRIAERDRKRGNQYAAAAKIVGQARIKLACMRFKEKRKQYRLHVKEIAKRELDAICKIQAVVRGIKGRKLFEEKLRDKKGKWKELFDEKIGKRFFYNKLSGEIRWRMPQDLLDLIPHPHCDNCHHVDATLECSVCNELFCGPCFDKVHSGGRRREHTFRALYDYYHKRLDYGDGEFPCKWPTEVMQDEVQGWMLRVAPQRAPVRRYASGWEAYEEGKIVPSKKVGVPSKIGNGGKIFYFNRNNFEATYEEPVEVVQEKEAEAAAALAAQEQQIATFAQSSGYYDANGTWVNTTDYYGAAGYDATQAGDMVPYQGDFASTYASEAFNYGDDTYYPPPTTANDGYYNSYANYGNPSYAADPNGYAQQVPAEGSYASSGYYPPQPGAGAYSAYDQSYAATPATAVDYQQSYDNGGSTYNAADYADGSYYGDQQGAQDSQQQVTYDGDYYDYEAPPLQGANGGAVAMDVGAGAFNPADYYEGSDDSSIESVEEL